MTQRRAHRHNVEATFTFKVSTLAEDKVKEDGLDPELLRAACISFNANAVANGRTAHSDFFEIVDVEEDCDECAACKEIA